MLTRRLISCSVVASSWIAAAYVAVTHREAAAGVCFLLCATLVSLVAVMCDYYNNPPPKEDTDSDSIA